LIIESVVFTAEISNTPSKLSADRLSTINYQLSTIDYQLYSKPPFKYWREIMAQNVDNIKDHVDLFHQPEYQELFQTKKEFEDGCGAEEVARVAEWTKSWDYREKNFAREALTINPSLRRLALKAPCPSCTVPKVV
jgi:Domain of unknown function (DUF3364)